MPPGDQNHFLNFKMVVSPVPTTHLHPYPLSLVHLHPTAIQEAEVMSSVHKSKNIMSIAKI